MSTDKEELTLFNLRLNATVSYYRVIIFDNYSFIFVLLVNSLKYGLRRGVRLSSTWKMKINLPWYKSFGIVTLFIHVNRLHSVHKQHHQP